MQSTTGGRLKGLRGTFRSSRLKDCLFKNTLFLKLLTLKLSPFFKVTQCQQSEDRYFQDLGLFFFVDRGIRRRQECSCSCYLCNLCLDDDKWFPAFTLQTIVEIIFSHRLMQIWLFLKRVTVEKNFFFFFTFLLSNAVTFHKR